MLELPVQFYRSYPIDPTAEHPALGHLGLARKDLELDEQRTVVAGMHLWNIGEPGGPDVTPDGPDWAITKLYDFYRDAGKALKDKIRPVFEATRAAGMTVVHIATGRYAHHYPQYARTLEKYDEPRSTMPRVCEDTSWRDEYKRDTYGFMSAEEGARDMNRVKGKIRISQHAQPAPEDEVVLNGDQLNNMLRDRGVNTIVYTGFSTNACLLEAPGGLLDMRKRKYRLVIVRDATAALEDTVSGRDRQNMKTAIRHIEQQFGYTCTADDLVASLDALRAGR